MRYLWEQILVQQEVEWTLRVKGVGTSGTGSVYHGHGLDQRRARLLGQVDPVDVGAVGQSVSHDREVLQSGGAVQQRPGVKPAEILLFLFFIWGERSLVLCFQVCRVGGRTCESYLTFVKTGVVLLENITGAEPWGERQSRIHPAENSHQQQQTPFIGLCSCPAVRRTCEPRQRGPVRFGFERRPLSVPILRRGSGSPGTGPPQQGVPARLRQLLDKLLFHVLRSNPRLLVSSEEQKENKTDFVNVRREEDSLWVPNENIEDRC